MATRLTRRFVGGMALIGAWSASMSAEPTRPLVSVPFFVTDARGQSIPNLKLADIEIAEAGEPQKISSVAFRGAGPRRVGIFLDEFHVSPDASARVRGSLGGFVERYLRADDAVVLMKPLDLLSGIAPVANVEALRQAVARFDGRRGVYAARGAFEAEYMSAAPPSAERQRAQVVRAGLEAMAIAMRDGGEAAKALIIVTEGFRASEPSRMRTTNMRSIARAARLATVPVYIRDPSVDRPAESPLTEPWRRLSTETGGVLFQAGSDLDAALARVAADMAAHYVLEFQGTGTGDGAFHGVELRVKRPGAQVRAASGYWAPFAASRFPPVTPSRSYANLLTPHASGLIQPWFRMAPAAGGKTRVTFSWVPRPGRKVAPERVEFSAITFEGDTVHAAVVPPLGTDGSTAQATFEAPPGPLQISMVISGADKRHDAARTAAARFLDTDVRYVEVPRLDASRPFIAAVELIRPRSLPELNAMRSDPAVMPTETRAFHRQDRLLVRVRAFGAAVQPEVQVRLLNRSRQLLMTPERVPDVDGASQFDLPLARYPRGDYFIEVRATGGETVTQLVSIRLIG